MNKLELRKPWPKRDMAGLALLLLLAAPLVSSILVYSSERPNVVLIVADDQAATDFGFMGNPAVCTPNLDRLAGRSLVLERGYVTSSLCCPSLASILTGQYPHQNGVFSNDPPKPAGLSAVELRRHEGYRAARQRMHSIAASAPMLPRILAASGYRCLQTGKWWHGHFSNGGFTHGMTHGDPDKGGRHGDTGLDIGRRTMKPIVDFVRDAKSASKPFFVWYAPMMPHLPHNPPERLLKKYRIPGVSKFVADYRASIEWFDETCGQLLGFLDAEGLASNTLVIFLADNGWIQSPDQARPIRSKLTPYDAGHRTPIVLSLPGTIARGRRTNPVSSIDIVPTVLARVGIDSRGQLPGVNLLDGAAVNSRQFVFGECFTHDAIEVGKPSTSLRFRWVVAGNLRLIVPNTKLEKTGVELYDLGNDPDESHNLAGVRPADVARLRGILDAWWLPNEQ